MTTIIESMITNGRKLSKMPYSKYKISVARFNTNIGIEISSTDLVLIVFINWGRKLIIARNPAAYPMKSTIPSPFQLKEIYLTLSGSAYFHKVR